ncbi:MAG: signal peptidase II [Parasphingopyxis sp.]|uniref:signal peptidase II n=1 Tax=Parasphingopyxis sp. TaxID=1920299 RepID=UPI0032EF5B9F
MTLNAVKRLAPVLILASFGLDQLSKSWAHAFVGSGNVIAIFPGFNLVVVTNSGVAFGLAGEAAPAILIAIGLLLSGLLGIWLMRTRSSMHALGLSLAIGGALGNVADRLIFGAVRDFIDLYWGNLHWPSFNLADVAIVAGLALLLLVGEEQAKTRANTGQLRRGAM